MFNNFPNVAPFMR